MLLYQTCHFPTPHCFEGVQLQVLAPVWSLGQIVPCFWLLRSSVLPMILIDKISHIEETGLERLCDLPWITQLEVTKRHYMFDILCWVTSCFRWSCFLCLLWKMSSFCFLILIASFLRRVAQITYFSCATCSCQQSTGHVEIAYQILLNWMQM